MTSGFEPTTPGKRSQQVLELFQHNCLLVLPEPTHLMGQWVQRPGDPQAAKRDDKDSVFQGFIKEKKANKH